MKFGIDISAWQKGLDLVQAAREGVQFAILKAGGADCGLYKDSQFDNFYQKCGEIGMPVGAYFFAACSDVAGAEREADYFIKLISGKKFPVKVWYDIEGKMTGLSREVLNAIAKAFCRKVKAAGFDCGVYSSASVFSKIDFDKSFSNEFPQWVASWGKSRPGRVRDGIDAWQYGGETNLIRSNKIAGKTVDQDYIYFEIGASPVIPVVRDDVAMYTIRYGNIGDKVRQLQRNLNEAINAGLVVDGIFGPKTLAAVKAFQGAHGLVVDGIYGPKTYAKMKEVLK